jgi:hypothetical protein
MRAVVRNDRDLTLYVGRVVKKLGSDLGGKPYTISLRRFHRPRTTDQNAKCHAMMREVAEHAGYSEGEIKDYIKTEFGPKRMIKLLDEHKEVPVSSTEWNVLVCSKIIDHLYEIGAHIGCVFQEADEDA